MLCVRNMRVRGCGEILWPETESTVTRCKTKRVIFNPGVLSTCRQGAGIERIFPIRRMINEEGTCMRTHRCLKFTGASLET